MTERDRRAFRLGGVAILVGLLATRAVPAIVHWWSASGEELAARRELLGTVERTLAQEGALEEAAAGTRSRLVALAPRLVSGTTEAEALADLNGRLALAGRRARTRILRADQVTDSTRVARLRLVRVRLTVESDWSGLVSFFRATVDDPAVLRISSISVRSPSAGGSGPEILTGALEVSGWYLAGEPAQGGR